MQGDAPQAPEASVAQEVKSEVEGISQSSEQTPKQPVVDPQTPPESTSSPKPKKKSKKKKLVIGIILSLVLAIVAYGIFLAVTYQSCSAITPEVCEINNKCGLSLTGFKSTSDIKNDCCGNEICEVGETSSDCTADCPNCDDNSLLTADNFSYKTQKCENIVTHYFIEDFEGNKTGIDKKVNWKIIDELGDKVLDCPGKKINGVENDWASFGSDDWANYESELNFKLVENLEGFGFHFFSKGEQGYIVDIRDRKITLKKGGQQGRVEVSLEPFDFELDKWYLLKTEKAGNDIKIYIDDVVVLEYTDNEPLDTGRFRIETFGDGHVRLDDISISK